MCMTKSHITSIDIKWGLQPKHSPGQTSSIVLTIDSHQYDVDTPSKDSLPSVDRHLGHGILESRMSRL